MKELYAATVDELTIPTQDGGVVHADAYGGGDRGVVLAHGMRFNKASWKLQAAQLAHSGFRVVAIDFRGYGNSYGGSRSQSPREEMYLDVLAAVDYLRGHGAKSVAVVGASMGGGASAKAAVIGDAGSMDRLILLAPVAIDNPEAIRCPKLYVTAEWDSIATQVKDQYERATEPKQLLILDGDAHAQFLFATDQSQRLMQEIVRFLR